MRMSKKTEYAVHSLVIIACRCGSHVQLEELAEKQNISKSYLAKVMQELSKTGMIKASPGVNGGYCIGKELTKITLADIFRVFEDTPKSISCQFANRNCDAQGVCEITQRVGKAFEKLYEELEKTSLADLVAKADVSSFSLSWLKG
ncbi:Rrf2 family transcriptional regulator [Geovibrio thiophilus]|uniref:Rrf2 family transcriptional regulator n=1 Tax=Geovibrio thiophilus TaxID=139438 RepID=A0A3R5X2Y8_9BACT|nr:Rrf2 family transcriptional regulator [Geovibrio thiophilus]QAR33286.1 Rrf2 family transcriptional regulator [Geovibrio thiophilus]